MHHVVRGEWADYLAKAGVRQAFAMGYIVPKAASTPGHMRPSWWCESARSFLRGHWVMKGLTIP